MLPLDKLPPMLDRLGRRGFEVIRSGDVVRCRVKVSKNSVGRLDWTSLIPRSKQQLERGLARLGQVPTTSPAVPARLVWEAVGLAWGLLRGLGSGNR